MGLIGPVVLVAVWSLLTVTGTVPSYLLPTPGEVLASGWEYGLSGALLDDTLSSMGRVTLGFVLGSFLGVMVGGAVASFPVVGLALEPGLNVLRHIPPLAWVPFALLWFRGGLMSAVFIVLLVSFFPVLISTTHGLRATPIHLVEMARTAGAGGWRIMWSVALPAALPPVVGSLRVALGGGWMAVVAAEYFGYRHGLGALAFNAYQVMRIDLVVVAMVSIGLVGFAMDALMRVLTRRTVWWAGR